MNTAPEPVKAHKKRLFACSRLRRKRRQTCPLQTKTQQSFLRLAKIRRLFQTANRHRGGSPDDQSGGPMTMFLPPVTARHSLLETKSGVNGHVRCDDRLSSLPIIALQGNALVRNGVRWRVCTGRSDGASWSGGESQRFRLLTVVLIKGRDDRLSGLPTRAANPSTVHTRVICFQQRTQSYHTRKAARGKAARKRTQRNTKTITLKG